MTSDNILIAALNIFCGTFCIVLAIPLLKGRIKPNGLYGVRFRKSFESDELWYAINRHGARRMIFWSVVVIASGAAALFVPFQGREWLMLIFALVPMVYLIGALESWRYAKRL